MGAEGTRVRPEQMRREGIYNGAVRSLPEPRIHDMPIENKLRGKIRLLRVYQREEVIIHRRAVETSKGHWCWVYIGHVPELFCQAHG